MAAWELHPPSAAVLWDARLEPLLALTRGGLPESVCRGVLVVADQKGRVRAAVGDPEAGVHLRSAAKPFQALALLESGAADALGFSRRELALACASHSGTEEHVAVVEALLARIGCTAQDLECGILPPLDRAEADRLRRSGIQFSRLHHMCSGKHAAMLALARHLDVAPAGYSQLSHPVQQLIFTTLVRETGMAPEAMRGGSDGCGVPVLHLPARLCALLYARLAAGASPAFERLRDAMLAFPRLVAGAGFLDTRIMEATAGLVVAKSGAGGVLGTGRLPGGEAGAALGCVVKLAADPGRHMAAIAAEELRAWGAVEAAEAVCPVQERGIRNTLGELVGSVECSAALRGALAASFPVPAVGRGAGIPAGSAAAAGASRPAAAAAASNAIAPPAPGFSVRLETVDPSLSSFLEREWPAAERETVGTTYAWTSHPLAAAARRGRRVIGVAAGNLVGGVLELAELLVADGERGRGVGSALLAAVEGETWRRDGHRVVVQVWAGSAAETFYRQRGYTQLSILPGHYQRGVQALLVKDRAAEGRERAVEAGSVR